MNYGYSRTVDKDFNTVNESIRDALMNRGFGVITEIDVAATVKAKLDKDFRRYIILGACNPPIAYSALHDDLNIGLLLPCNVIFWENDDKSVTVAAIDSEKLLSLTGQDGMQDTARQVNNHLKAALDSL